VLPSAYSDSVGTQNQLISELNTLPADTPVQRFKCDLTTALAWLGARVARYAFPVRLFHSLLHAGLSRRYPERRSAPAGGASSATFSVTTVAVGAATAVKITAAYDGLSSTYPLTVNALTLSQSSWSFGTQQVGTSSAPDKVTVANSGKGAITISSITSTGANSADFGQSNNCLFRRPCSPRVRVA